MPEGETLEGALASIARDLSSQERRFALVGGLAVSVRSEVRFTRDVDLAVATSGDADAEGLVFALRGKGYRSVASVEHDTKGRLSTVRLMSPRGVKVDLLFASSGIEPEIVDRSTSVEAPLVGGVRVARTEELLAMKVLSMSDIRLQDRLDAQRLLQYNPDLDLTAVRDDLGLITERGYHRDQDLEGKLASLLAVISA